MGYELGATVANTTRKTYVNLRCGVIAETSSEEKPGFEPDYTTKKDGTKTHFFAKKYREIVGYVTRLDWHVSTFKDGSTDGGGWNVDIDTGETVFCLSVKKQDRPFLRFCSVLCGIDFHEPVRFAGYKFNEGGGFKKVLALYQFGTEGAMQPFFQEKWLSNLLKQKIREKLELTDDDKRNLAFAANGKLLPIMVFDEIEGTFSGGYPYIVRGADDKWDLTIWSKFLDAKVKELVLPAIAEANAVRQSKAVATNAEEIADLANDPFPTFAGDDNGADDSDNIPF